MPPHKPPKPDWLQQTQCHGKHRFEDGGFAKKVAKQSARRKDSKASAYRCMFCGGWHVGNGGQKKQRKK
jgi:hypothetical protein